MSSYLRNSNIFEDTDWNELEQKIKEEVNGSQHGLPPGLLISAVGNQEHSNSSHHSHSQEEVITGFPNLGWYENYNTKASFGQGYPQGFEYQFLGQVPNSQAHSFGNPKALKYDLNLASPAFNFKFSQEKIQEGIVKQINQQSFGEHLAQMQMQEYLPKESQNENRVYVEEQEQKPEQEKLKEKQTKIDRQEEIQNEQSSSIEPSIQIQEDSSKENKNENKEEIQKQGLKGHPEIKNNPENPKMSEAGNQSEWEKPLKPKKEGKDDKNRSQQTQKSDEKETRKLTEDKKISGKIVAGGGDFKSQSERIPENNKKSENIAGKETKEGNAKSFQAFEKESDQIKKYTNNNPARSEKKSTKKEFQNNEKTKSQDGWENSRTKTTQLKSEGSFKQNNNKLKPFKTPFGLLMFQNSENSDELKSNSRNSSDDDKEIEENKQTEVPASKENIIEQKSSNLETSKETKETEIDNKKKKKKNKKKKDETSSLVDVPEKDEKGRDEEEKQKQNIVESQPEVEEDLDDTNNDKTKKKKKKKKPVVDRDDEKVDPMKVNKQIEPKEVTSKSFAAGAGKESVNKEPFLERLLFVPPVGYYDYLVSLMKVQDSKEQRKE